MSLPTSRTYSQSADLVGSDLAGYTSMGSSFNNLLDDILYQLSTDTREETEGQFEQAEALADNAYTILSYIQDNVPAEQQADAVAEYLREAKFSSDVVSQMLNIPKSDVNAALAGAGYDETGQPLPQPTPQEMLGSTVGTQTATFGTNEQLEQERQTLIDIIREAGGEVGAAAVEGIADLGNLVIQAVTLGKGPQLEAVVPNIMDLIKGGIGGQLVLGGGPTPATVVGTGQTGPGRGTKVAVGGIFGTIADIFKQGGNLGTVITQFPSILIDNLPGVIAAAASAGYAFTDDDKTTAVKMGVEPSILDAIDDDKTVVAGTDTATVKTGSTNLEDLGAGGPDTSILDNQTKTTTTTKFDDVGTTTTKILDGLKLPTDDDDPPKDILFTMGSPEFETTTTRTGPTLATTLGEDQSQVKTTPVDLVAALESEQVKSTVTPAELAAILGSESTETIRTSTAPTLTAALGGGSSSSASSGVLPVSSGQRLVQVDPRGVVDIDYLYDFAKGLDQPFVATEEEEDELLKAAEGGQVKKFKTGGATDAEKLASVTMGQATGFGPVSSGSGSVNPIAAGPIAAGLAALGGIFGATQSSGLNQPQGYQGGIPEYTATRTLQPDAFSQTTTDPVTGETVARRPGSMGRRYFSDVAFTPVADAGLPAIADQSQDQGDTVVGDGTTPTLSDLIGSTGLANLLSSLGLGGGTASSTFTPGTSADSTTTTTTPGESTFSLGDTTTTTDVSVASDPVSQYLQSLGYGTTVSPVSATDIQSAVGEGFSLADIAGAFGTTEDVLNQILNPSSSTTISTPASSTFTAGDTTTSTTLVENALNDFFAGRGFVAGEEQTVTQDDLNAALAAGFTVDQLAAGLGTTVDNINAVLDYQYYAAGGMASLDGMGQGYYLGGPTDGMADLVPATIDGTQPAALSDGEFVIPADVVSHLGNGNSDAGAKQLYSMMDRVRQERTGTTKQGPEINPTKMMPA